MRVGMVQAVQFDELTQAFIDAAADAGVGVVVSSARAERPRIEFVSTAIETILGEPARDLIGREALDLSSDREKSRLQDMASAVSRREPTPHHFETEARRRGGTSVPVEVAVSFIDASDHVLSVTCVVDITERRRAMVDLERSERRLRHVIESAPVAVWILDERSIHYANAAAADLFGFSSPEEALTRDPKDLLETSEVSQLEQRLAATLVQRRKLPPQEYRIRRMDGVAILVEVSSIAIEWDGRPAVLAFGRDVTQRRQLEMHWLQADRLAALGLVAGGMAHAINNPLTYVLLNLDHVRGALADGSALDGDAAGVLARLTEAYQGIERIAQVVKRMRAFSRVDERSRSAVDLRSVLEGALELVGHELTHRGRLTTNYSEVPAINASAAHLEQVFLHLLVHAAQSLPEDDSAEVRIELSSLDVSQVMVAVTIVGRALEPSALANVFEPFFTREEDTEARVGLPFCRAVVSAMGGELLAETDTVAGTTFRVILPVGILESEPPEVEPVSVRAQVLNVRPRVLVIDDDPGIGGAMSVALEDNSDVTYLPSALEARDRLIAGERFDLVFCDMMMPDLDGEALWEVVQRVRPEQAARFVFMTAAGTHPKIAEFFTRTGCARLDKPFRLNDVQRAIAAFRAG
ncbi:MAG: PAS domain S-box protein [Polyangiaceae bacterium]